MNQAAAAIDFARGRKLVLTYAELTAFLSEWSSRVTGVPLPAGAQVYGARDEVDGEMTVTFEVRSESFGPCSPTPIVAAMGSRP